MKNEENSEFAFVFVRVEEAVADFGEKKRWAQPETEGFSETLKGFQNYLILENFGPAPHSRGPN